MFVYLRLAIYMLVLLSRCFKYAASQGGEHPNSRDAFHNFNGKGTLQFLEKNSDIDCCTLSQPCQNGGNCSIGENGLTSCECPDGFTGPTCNISCSRMETCPPGFSRYEAGEDGICYHFSPAEVGSFLEAQEYCRNLHPLSSLWEPTDFDSAQIPPVIVGLYETQKGPFWSGWFDGLTENSPICVGTGKPPFILPLPIVFGNGPTNDCVQMVFNGKDAQWPKWFFEYQYFNCATNNRCVCEILSPCDIPTDPVLPVPRLQ